MSIVAALDKVLFFNASSKYSVLRMKTEDSSVPAEARSPYRYHDHLIRFTAVGIELPQTDRASEKRPPTRSLKSLASMLWRFWNISQTGFLRFAALRRNGLRRSRTPMRKPAGCVS